MRFLTCEPNLKKIPDYEDEANIFFNWPMKWIKANIPSYPSRAKPCFIVLYSQLADQLEEFLITYIHIDTIYHTRVILINIICYCMFTLNIYNLVLAHFLYVYSSLAVALVNIYICINVTKPPTIELISRRAWRERRQAILAIPMVSAIIRNIPVAKTSISLIYKKQQEQFNSCWMDESCLLGTWRV